MFSIEYLTKLLVCTWLISRAFTPDALAAGGTKSAIEIDPARPSDFWLAAGVTALLPLESHEGLLSVPSGTIGWFEYKFQTPTDGWRELSLEGRPDAGRVELEIDAPAAIDRETPTQRGSLRPEQWVWLAAGAHRLRVITNHWTGLPRITSIRLNSPKPDQPSPFRLSMEGNPRAYARGHCPLLKIIAGGESRATQISIAFESRGHTFREQTISAPPAPEPTVHEVAAPCDSPGDVSVSVSSGGENSLWQKTEKAYYSVFETVTVEPFFKRGGLRLEIDAAARAPDFLSGETNVAGVGERYRESGNHGATPYIRRQSSAPPDWFAYRVSGLKPNRPYIVDIEYPDNAARSMIFAFRDASEIGYPVSVGLETGGAWGTNGGVAHREILIWSSGNEARFIIYNVHDGFQSAVAHIRIYDAEPIQVPAVSATSHGRDFLIWYEEGKNFFDLVGEGHAESSIHDAIDRYMQLVRSTGASIIVPTVAVYNFTLYPSVYQTTFLDSDLDLTAALLLGAQHYGLKVIPELHPRADELLWSARTFADYNRRLLLYGKEKTPLQSSFSLPHPPFYNPLDPDVRKWYLNIVGELAERYRNYDNFSGVQLRLSDWQNPALNNLVSLDWGYNTSILRRFFTETGIAAPAEMNTNDDSTEAIQGLRDIILDRWRERWVQWRCEQIRDILQDIVARVRGARADLNVHLNFFLSGGAGQDYEKLREAGIDINLLKAVDGLVLIDSRFGYGAREAPTLTHAKALEPFVAQGAMALLASSNGRSSMIFPMEYIELPLAKVSPSGQIGLPSLSKEPWISSASRPPGRLALAQYARAMGEFDPYLLGDGGNGYIFSIEGLKEFMVEFRALPRAPFQRMNVDSKDYAIWKRDRQFYVVSLTERTQSVQIELKNVQKVERLTTGERVEMRNQIITLELAPYQLLTFRTDVRAETVSSPRR